jgi:23S rRNA pseudouridine2605 synthase
MPPKNSKSSDDSPRSPKGKPRSGASKPFASKRPAGRPPASKPANSKPAPARAGAQESKDQSRPGARKTSGPKRPAGRYATSKPAAAPAEVQGPQDQSRSGSRKPFAPKRPAAKFAASKPAAAHAAARESQDQSHSDSRKPFAPKRPVAKFAASRPAFPLAAAQESTSQEFTAEVSTHRPPAAKRPFGKTFSGKSPFAQKGTKKETSELVRLQKVLAESGIASRRHSEEIILAGRVKVDGLVTMELGVRVNPRVQNILVDDEPIQSERKVYYLVNKPIGHISTNDDPAGRPRVIDLLPKTKERLFPVGRLDESSQGLVLVTNDGPMANKLLHPRYGVPKTYRVQVAGSPDWKALESLHLGQEFSEGTFKVDSFKLLRQQGDSTFLEIVLKEGHNREIRRLFARIGHKVLKLERVAFGPLRIAKLGIGEFRHLTTFEVRQLRQVAAGQQVTGDKTDSEGGGRKKKSFRKKTTGKPRS